jgi:hypothetical protein
VRVSGVGGHHGVGAPQCPHDRLDRSPLPHPGQDVGMWNPRPQEVQRRPWAVSPQVPQLTAASSAHRTRGSHEALGGPDPEGEPGTVPRVIGTSVRGKEAKEVTGRPFSAR